jgi:hypothetical protein
MHAADGPEDRGRIQRVRARRFLQLVRQHVEQHLGIGVGIDVAQVLPEQVALELIGVGQVAVVPQHDAKGRVDVERLRLGGVFRRPRGGIAAMRDAGLALKIAHVARAEHVAHQPAALLHVEGALQGSDDAGRVLPAVLEHEQAVVEQLIDRRLRDDSDDSAHRQPV